MNVCHCSANFFVFMGPDATQSVTLPRQLSDKDMTTS